MIYTFSSKNRGSKFLDIEFLIENIKDDEILVQLPAWRPGRYELANFAKNIQQFSVQTLNNKELLFEKITKDRWKIKTGKSKKIIIKYNYYANELNAGSTWVDESQIYINPVNCCLFVVGRENDPIKLFFNETQHKQTATSLQKIGDHFVAENFDELA
ncbi:MAG: putative metalloprotease with PDZ domain, partial [Flavobacteriales bacterium]